VTQEQLKAISKLAQHIQIDRVDEVYLGAKIVPENAGYFNRAGDVKMYDWVTIFKLVRMGETEIEWWVIKDDAL
jgi:hypothetical protein